MSERLSVSFDERTAARVRACAATNRGGASGYLARLVREDELRQAGDQLAAFYTAHPSFIDDAEAERIAAAGE
ncbi:hypothetical protein [Pseudonocardia parietis]|uniref:Uncharacterized protein n=1 Tax=Pseudonocardia parietis TaxID=570936 RepID=A0ABS4VVT5_9PSEU|nr:hypothetical protein [Pseudonocardia parietis]MBP2368027.1 hypothetical protein [Pseudonocardia parietis]